MSRYQLIAVLLALFTASSLHAAPICVSHRGNDVPRKDQTTTEYTEGTMASILNVVRIWDRNFSEDIPFIGVEFDVHETKDHVVILSHDHTVVEMVHKTPACPAGKKISTLTWEELSKCRLLTDPLESENYEGLTRLEELLEHPALKNPDIKLFLEFKDAPGLRTLRLLRDYMESHPGKVTVISFLGEALRRVEAFMPERLDFKLLLLIAGHCNQSNVANQEFDGVDLNDCSTQLSLTLKEQGRITAIWYPIGKAKIEDHFARGADYVTTDNFVGCLEVLRESMPPEPKK